MKAFRFVTMLLAAACIAPSSTLLAADEAPTPDDVRFFELRIRPLLAENCFNCHGSDRQKAGLRLDSLEGTRRPAKSGIAVIVPGKPDESLLIKAVHYDEQAPR